MTDVVETPRGPERVARTSNGATGDNAGAASTGSRPRSGTARTWSVAAVSRVLGAQAGFALHARVWRLASLKTRTFLGRHVLDAPIDVAAVRAEAGLALVAPADLFRPAAVGLQGPALAQRS